MRLLVVEDDPSMVGLLRRALEREAYAVDVAATGDEALWALAEHDYDAVVLDVMIPGPDGFEVVRRTRARGQPVPILMLTARDAIGDRVTGLDAGADDYLTKPFAVAELFARVRALVRRGPAAQTPRLQVGDLVLDPSTHEATRAGEPLELTPKAFALLEYLMRRPGEVVTRADLLAHVWDFAYDGGSNVVDAYIRRVREVVDRPAEASCIETVRGVGYRLRA